MEKASKHTHSDTFTCKVMGLVYHGDNAANTAVCPIVEQFMTDFFNIYSNEAVEWQGYYAVLTSTAQKRGYMAINIQTLSSSVIIDA